MYWLVQPGVVFCPPKTNSVRPVLPLPSPLQFFPNETLVHIGDEGPFYLTATQHDHLVTVCHGYVREFNTSKEKLSVLLRMLARIFHSKISLHTSMTFLSWAKLKSKTFSKSWTEFYLTWETTGSSSKKQCAFLSSAEYLGHHIRWGIEAYTADIHVHVVWAVQQPPVSQPRSF